MRPLYELVVRSRSGAERVREYAADEPPRPGQVLVLDGRHWLVERVEAPEGAAPPRAFAKPARYRLRLRHPDGHEELGAFRRFRPGGPRLGHAFSTLEDGRPVSWEVVEERLARDSQGEPFLDLLAARDYRELEEIPDHELEHTLAPAEETPTATAELLSRAEEAGRALELVALDPGEEPDWAEAERFIDALVLEEVEDDLLELCGVDPDTDPRDTWLATVKHRLREDLDRFRGALERGGEGIERWDFAGGCVLASEGSFEDETDPDSPHGWLCRLVDAGALAAAGFRRVRKAEL